MVSASIIAAMLAAASATPVTVEIVSSGHVDTPAQKYRLAASLQVCATSQAEADRELARKGATIDARLRAIGVVPAASSSGGFSLTNMLSEMRPGLGTLGCDATTAVTEDEAIAGALASDDDADSKPEPVADIGATRSFALDAPSAAAAGRAIALLKAEGAKPGEKTIPMLTDEIGAKRAAKQQALTKARAEADSYAALLGGKAVLTRISERQDLGQQSMDFMSQIFRMFGKGSGDATDSVATDVTITVEFALDGAR